MTGGMYMKFELDDIKIVNVLKAVKNEYSNSRTYYKQHIKAEERIGVSNPSELKELYNKLLEQAKQQGQFIKLNFIN
ncbi:hypothetical protein IRP63_06385 [Clostridium botulinum]|uniref:Uncharacterized protein n=2 Tax=Clostridium botulinum TaxID=1491 RepID=A0A0A0IDP7_CLOBO|nr:hypothetical protein Z952_02900 [Clostridium botulinum C/D str. BKT75002]KEI11609.1 hypothetical protein Z954_07535 [Clostridium botulinum C/D str. BKT2873]KGM99082.1 hypothetical protein Z955_08850 [Clostridium botulinum C/D str. DC5]KOC54454.1 hypothetical protein ADU89_07540 [Clostridium botulinum]MCD3233918.1 hypothetical protein [Clostridium botulinum D/C]